MARLAKVLLLCGCVLEALALPAAADTANEWAPVMLPAAQHLDVRAAASGYAYRIFVAAPAVPPPPAGYPVLYVLDGNAAFPVAAFLARGTAARSEVTGYQPPVVVGIGYPGDRDFDVAARRRDYTVASDKTGPAETEGGANRFLDFIEHELKPLIAARYPVDRQRQALFGHSFGGLFVLHALFTRPAAFSTYLASSPSIWWADKAVLRGLPALLESKTAPRVQISVGALEDDPPKGNVSPDVRALVASRKMIPAARSLAGQLQESAGWERKVAYYELAGEDHGPVWMPAMTRGMQFFMEQP